jgi:hypothetical protein
MGADNHAPAGCEYSGARGNNCPSAGRDAGREFSNDDYDDHDAGSNTSAGRDLSNDDYDHDDYDTGRSASSHARGGGSCATNVVRGTYRFRR